MCLGRWPRAGAGRHYRSMPGRVAAARGTRGGRGGGCGRASAPYYFPIEQADLLAYVQPARRGVAAAAHALQHAGAHADDVRARHDSATARRAVDRRHEGQLGRPAIISASVCEMARARNDWSVFVGQEASARCRRSKSARTAACAAGRMLHPQLFVQLYEATLATTDTSIAEQGDVLPHLVDHADRLAKIFRVAAGRSRRRR